MTAPRCTCGAPATQQVPVGWVLRGTTWHRYWTRACFACAVEERYEREAARAG